MYYQQQSMLCDNKPFSENMVSKALDKALNLKIKKYSPCYQVPLVKKEQGIQNVEYDKDEIVYNVVEIDDCHIL